MALMAATPFSPISAIICILNRVVVMALARLVTISDEPFPTALRTSGPFHTGFSKCMRFFLLKNTVSGTSPPITIPATDATAAPVSPKSKNPTRITSRTILVTPAAMDNPRPSLGLSAVTR